MKRQPNTFTTLQDLPIDLPVAEFLSSHQHAIHVFLHFRMSCVGCSMSAFDTLGEALATYHISPDTFWQAIQHTSPLAARDESQANHCTNRRSP